MSKDNRTYFSQRKHLDTILNDHIAGKTEVDFLDWYGDLSTPIQKDARQRLDYLKQSKRNLRNWYGTLFALACTSDALFITAAVIKSSDDTYQPIEPLYLGLGVMATLVGGLSGYGIYHSHQELRETRSLLQKTLSYHEETSR